MRIKSKLNNQNYDIGEINWSSLIELKDALGRFKVHVYAAFRQDRGHKHMTCRTEHTYLCKYMLGI